MLSSLVLLSATLSVLLTAISPFLTTRLSDTNSRSGLDDAILVQNEYAEGYNWNVFLQNISREASILDWRVLEKLISLRSLKVLVQICKGLRDKKLNIICL